MDKTMAAPATAIVAFDPSFHTKMRKLMPSRPELGATLAVMPEEWRPFATLQNGALEG